MWAIVRGGDERRYQILWDALHHGASCAFVTGNSATRRFDVTAPSQRRDSAVVTSAWPRGPARGFRFSTALDAELGGPLSGWGGNLAVNKSW